MAKGDRIPDADEVTRWIKPKLIGKDDYGNVIVDDHGRPKDVFPQAFELREDEAGLSLTWLQEFGRGREVHLPQAAEAVRLSQTSLKLSAKSAFAIAEVEAVLALGKEAGSSFRMVHEPEPSNSGHCELRRYPRELGFLQAALASSVFSERYLYADVRQAGWTPPDTDRP